MAKSSTWLEKVLFTRLEVKMAGIKWTDDEVRILDQYERTAKSAFVLYQECRKAGYNRTYKAVTRKIESLGLRKPKRYVTGHEKTYGYLDIESTGFSANIDLMLSWCIKPRGGKTVGAVITREELMSDNQDARIVETLVEEMNKYDVICTYYGTRFDIPFIRTRALYHGTHFPMYRQKSHKDLYYVIASYITLQTAKTMVIRKLERAESIGTFLRTQNGYRVTAPEGYVAIDHIGKAMKLVDRLEFSRANFSANDDWKKG